MQAACTWPAPSDGWDIERCHSAVWQEAEALLERLGSEGDAAIMVTERPIPYHGKTLRHIMCKNLRHIM
jgi:hypothetical protein